MNLEKKNYLILHSNRNSKWKDRLICLKVQRKRFEIQFLVHKQEVSCEEKTIIIKVIIFRWLSQIRKKKYKEIIDVIIVQQIIRFQAIQKMRKRNLNIKLKSV
ncbi:unnamed protein product [Paramecium sonneborni]|uniref:Uncharacterized protein n=1 Tax=Paramecium sonneborni TaxID=65129 RepID=A0A8S1N5L2_9CILI|nr:unnamed protein product [Paramecium sonneborni]